MDDGSRRAGMVHAVIIRSGAADAAAGATGMAAFMIHLHRVGVKRLAQLKRLSEPRVVVRRRVLLISTSVCYLHTINSLQCKGRVM